MARNPVPSSERHETAAEARLCFANPQADFEPDTAVDAPGKPGISPSWTSSAKDAVGCSLGPPRLWFTIGYGIVNEVYWPRTDLPQIRDLGFIVADGRGFWSEVKRSSEYTIHPVMAGVPAFEIVHTHARYMLRLRVTPDPRRDVLLIACNLDSDEPEMARATGSPLGGHRT